MGKSKEAKDVWAAISDEKGYPLDRAGSTRLTKLVDKIKSLSPKSQERKAYAWAIRDLAALRSKLSCSQIRNLCRLICLSEMRKTEYRFAFLNNFYRWGKLRRGDLIKRAEIFRLIGESGKMPDDFLLSETAIRRRYPCYWIDVAVYTNWRLAIEEIKKWLQDNHEDAQLILLRLAHWQQMPGRKIFLKRIIEILKSAELSPKDQESLELFLKMF